MLNVMIADTWGGWPLHKACQRAFPNAHFVDHAPRPCTTEPHPHGFMVASRLLLPLIDEKVQVHFVPFLGETAPDDPFAWLLKKAAEIEPHIWINSWGQSRMPIPQLDEAIAAWWQPWIDEERRLRDEIGYWILFAAGNTDTRGLGYSDVGYPTRLMHEAVVVGAVDRTGRTTPWTADGNVTCSEFGHYVYILNPLTGLWELGSGTSFSCPSEAGVIGSCAPADWHGYIQWLMRNATRPIGFTDEEFPHLKFGYGCTTDYFEAVCREHDAFARTGMRDQRLPLAPGARLRWFDFMKLD